MTIEEIKEKLKSPILWGNLLAMAVVTVILFFVVWTWLGIYTHNGEKITVPDVQGKPLADVEYTLEMMDLKAVVVDSVYDHTQPSGTVMSQLPKAGSQVKSGREIYLTINSKSSPLVALPDIADNCSLREAQDRLRQLGFRLGPVEETEGDKDWVYGVKCQGRMVMAGERVPNDAVITLIVGTGLEEQKDTLAVESPVEDNSDLFDYD